MWRIRGGRGKKNEDGTVQSDEDNGPQPSPISILIELNATSYLMPETRQKLQLNGDAVSLYHAVHSSRLPCRSSTDSHRLFATEFLRERPRATLRVYLSFPEIPVGFPCRDRVSFLANLPSRRVLTLCTSREVRVAARRCCVRGTFKLRIKLSTRDPYEFVRVSLPNGRTRLSRQLICEDV